MAYLTRIAESAKLIKDYPKILIPDIVLLISVFVISTALYYYSGFAEFIKANALIEPQIEMVKEFLDINATRLTISFAVFVATTFFVGAGALAWKFSLLKYLLQNKKPALKEGAVLGKEYFWRIILIKICVYIIGILTAALVLLVGAFIYFLLKPTTNSATAIAFLISLLIGLLLAVYITLSLLYRYPILFLKQKNPFQAIRDSYELFKKNRINVLIVWLIMLGIGIIAGLIMIASNKAFASLDGLILVAVASSVIASLIRIFANVLSEVFVFKMFVQFYHK